MAVEGHSGKLIFGKLGNKAIMAMQGRFHYYEGYSIRELTAILKRKESTLQTQLAAGRRKLKEELKKAGEIPQNWEREGK